MTSRNTLSKPQPDSASYPVTTTDSLSAAMVYNHLIMVSPKLVEEFSASLKFHQSSLKLADVMAANVKKPLHAINETKKNSATTRQKKTQ